MSTRTDNLRKNRDQLGKWIVELDRAIHEIAINGTASASVSAAGAVQQYTRLDLDKLKELRADYSTRYTQVVRALRAGSGPAGIRHILTVRS